MSTAESENPQIPTDAPSTHESIALAETTESVAIPTVAVTVGLLTPTKLKSIRRSEGIDLEQIDEDLPAMRKRRSVEIYTPELPKEPTPFVIQTGKGKELSSIEKVVENVRNTSRNSEILMDLHKFLYGRAASVAKIKDNILKFSGFVYQNEEKEREKYIIRLSKFTRPAVVEFVELFALDKNGTKDELVERVIDFLENPQPNGTTKVTPKKDSTKTTTPKKEETKVEQSKPKSSTTPAPKTNKPASSETPTSASKKAKQEKSETPERPMARRTPSRSISRSLSQSSMEDEKAAEETKAVADAETIKAESKPEDESTAAPSGAAATEKDADEAMKDVEAKDEAKPTPIEDEIREQLKAIIPTVDLESTTPRQIKESLEKHFNASLESKNDFITETLRQLLSEAAEATPSNTTEAPVAEEQKDQPAPAEAS
eukprot:TRINITY_DN9058_c0_g1_i1.p1 TRINITY_DN9058_c0_g1~~TRINITY_DN9058_c0_g1_i1.p1  ORF type:complete len:430 (+),score=133.69 TRINITY_DN9058_c0_g1_i1:73-1362(+)